MTVRIGAAEVDRVEEQQFPVPLSLLVARLYGERAYSFPAHFAAPHYGLVERDGRPPSRGPGRRYVVDSGRLSSRTRSGAGGACSPPR